MHLARFSVLLGFLLLAGSRFGQSCAEQQQPHSNKYHQGYQGHHQDGHATPLGAVSVFHERAAVTLITGTQ